MKFKEYKIIEDCLEGSNVRDILLDEPSTKEFIYYFEKIGKLLFFDELPKPMYKIIVKGKYTIKGIAGNNTMRVLLPDNESDESLQELKEFINNYET